MKCSSATELTIIDDCKYKRIDIFRFFSVKLRKKCFICMFSRKKLRIMKENDYICKQKRLTKQLN